MSANGPRREGFRAALPFLIVIAILHLLVAWPGAGTRGIIAEEVQPYLHHYPKVLDGRRDDAAFLPPNDDPSLRAAVDAGRPVAPRWVGTNQWPEIGYQGARRVFPVFVRGHQTAIGTYWGVALGPLLGDGIAGVRRSNVLLGLGALLLVWALARRLGLSRGWATIATIACALSPGLWFFARTGYAFELASRVCMLACLCLAAPLEPLTRRRAAAVGAAFAAAVLCRATIAATLAPALLLMLFHPRRWAGPRRVAGALAVGGGLPIAFGALCLALLPFAAGTTPAAALPLGDLAARTLRFPAFMAAQLAFVVDARVVLSRILDGDLAAPTGWLRPAIGAVVVVAALHRWWHARAGEAERLLVGGLLGNALVSAWLYTDPRQFQLAMALDPLFAIALIHQISTLSRWGGRAASAAAALAIALRVWTLGSLWQSERRTDNPMLSGRAQRALVETLRAEGARGGDLITTAYDHVGVIESWTGEALRPIHAWPLLVAGAVPEDRVIEQWGRILDAHPACRVLLSRGRSLVAGRFSDDRAVARALSRAIEPRGVRIASRRVLEGDGGGPVFELVELSPCKRD